MSRAVSEVETECHLDDARVAAEDALGAVEVGVAGEDRVDLPDADGVNRRHVVRGAGDVLRVVEGVEEVGAELYAPAALHAEVEVLEDRDVEVVDAGELQSAARLA